MLTILFVILAIGVVIFVHELGHFIAARVFGVRVETFSIGFGPEWFGFSRGETRYRVSLIPFGGYIKMAGDNIFDADASHIKQGDFLLQQWWKRVVVVLAGPLMNVLFAVLVFFPVIHATGVMQPVGTAVVGSVLRDMPAARAGLIAGDEIVRINQKSVHTWDDVVDGLRAQEGTEKTVYFRRGTTAMMIRITPIYDKEQGAYIIGIGPQLQTKRLSYIESVWYSIQYVVLTMLFFLKAIVLMITGKLKPELMGPIGVAHSLGVAVQTGYSQFLHLLGLVSLNLGLINCMPLPILDGGHAMVYLWEGITRRPFSKKILHLLYAAGIVFLLFVMVMSTQQDITRLFFKK